MNQLTNRRFTLSSPGLIPLSQIANIEGGYAFKSADFSTVGFPVVKIANIDPPRVDLTNCERILPDKVHNLDRFRLDEGDILMAMTGATIGKVGRIRSLEPAYLNQRVAKLSAKSGPQFDDFLYALLSQNGFENHVLNNSTGSAQSNVSAEGIGRILVPDFDANEQIAIGRIISSLDDKIELNRKMNETLEAVAQALFKSWFVDFDPVRAKMQGQEPVGMDAKTAALFPDRLGESDLGEIPEGWQFNPVSSLTEINAKTLGIRDALETIEYVEISEVSKGNIGKLQLYQRGQEPSRARRILRHGDTVLSTVRPDRGSYFLCLHPSPFLIASTGFAVITPILAPWSFLYAALTRPELFEHLGLQADGGAYPAISPEIIGNWQIAYPRTSTVLDVFHRLCGPLYELAYQNRVESRTLAAIRDRLLPTLLSGDVSVPLTAVYDGVEA